jgi:hypothetical protein
MTFTRIITLISIFALSSCSDLLYQAQILSDINLREGQQMWLETADGQMVVAHVVSSDGTNLALNFSGDGTPEMPLIRVDDGLYSVDVNDDGVIDGYICHDDVGRVSFTSYSYDRGLTLYPVLEGGRFIGVDVGGNGLTDYCLPQLDTRTPNAPGGLAFDSVSYFSLLVSWSDAIDPPDPVTGRFSQHQVLGYQLYVSQQDIVTSADIEGSHEVLGHFTREINQMYIPSLAPDTTYYIAVGVKDAAGNFTISPALSATTLAPTPPVLSNPVIFMLPLSQSSIQIAWDAATDDESLGEHIRYYLYGSDLAVGFDPYSVDPEQFVLLDSWPKQNVTSSVIWTESPAEFWGYLVAEDEMGFRTVYDRRRMFTFSPIPPSQYYWSFEGPGPFSEKHFLLSSKTAPNSVGPARSLESGQSGYFLTSPFDTGIGATDDSATGETDVFTTEYTVSFWIKITDVNDTSCLLYIDSDTDIANGEDSVILHLSKLPDHRLRLSVGIDGSPPVLEVTDPVPPELWSMITITKTPDELLIFVDGRMQREIVGGQLTNAFDASILSAMSQEMSDLVFGGGYPGESDFTGYLDDIELFPYALSRSEVFSLYQAGKP